MIPLAPIFSKIKSNLLELEELLEKERSALATKDSDRIEKVASLKKSLLDDIDTQTLKHSQVLRKFNIVNQKNQQTFDFKKWLAEQSKMDDVKLLVEECESLLEKCKLVNNTNAKVLNTVQKRDKALLEMLQGHHHKNKVYTQSGGTKPISSKHTLGRA
ncbi:flagellar export chaperone FlgN [Marinomonas mediterranea]|jgi:FlgN protein.|uniref:FlgN family protein n=1 Tax=Marinomonas mediterranea (strain ATCC 700492 / JCM 21426 / NBRC 103028 / MMB-1) TaxID=717774 RepID=F2JT88_MARM1|nr:flagellar export chaperone FlgN [Marinomonas mediterranea]ADZ90306.1 FlgN family protein [Marinomonas mediterranea MMB-1]WCN08366.1 flagellar protein FlgN [Marinomonas mediterranea]WCN12422.1 flagellar protein FlgN [Marinomonas mediterranea]WCN16495.1 flagellar protein FlgN [Marinomonas mediterranea MMB-1]